MDERTWAALIWGLASVGLVAFCTIVGIGLATTEREGVPSLSRLIADSVALNASLGSLIFIAGCVRMTITVKATLMRSYWLTIAAATMGGIETTLFLLVTYVSLDVNTTLHFVLVSCAFGLGSLREFVLIGVRFSLLPKRTRKCYHEWLGFNAIFLATMISLAIAYAVVGGGDDNLMEYFIFALLFAMTYFHVPDYAPPSLSLHASSASTSSPEDEAPTLPSASVRSSSDTGGILIRRGGTSDRQSQGLSP